MPVMGCAPTDNPAVTQVATPTASGLATQPAMVTPASWKVTVPVGMGPSPVTVAVKVIDWPNTEGFTEDVTVVVDPAAATSTIPWRRRTMLQATANEIGSSGEWRELNRKAGLTEV